MGSITVAPLGGGVLSLKWAQNTTDGNAATVYANSFIEAREEGPVISGASGYSGFSGTYSGHSGSSGISGMSGFSGSIGDVTLFSTKKKPADTDRTLTSTPTSDPDLQVTLKPNMTYVLNSTIINKNVGANNASLRCYWDCTDTAAEVVISSLWYKTLNNSDFQTQGSFTNSFPGPSEDYYVANNSITEPASLVSTGIIKTTTGGVLSFKWSPNNFTSGYVMRIYKNSFLEVRENEGSASGTSGAIGQSGTSGFSGTFSGWSGTSGFSSPSGHSGFSGSINKVAVFDTPVKTADTSRTLYVSVDPDPDLQVTLNPNTTYIINSEIVMNSSGSPAVFNWDFTGTTSNVLLISMISAGGSTSTSKFDALPEPSNVYLGLSYETSINTTGVITTSGSGGTLSFNWAQSYSNANAVKTLKGSFLEIRENEGAASGVSGISGTSGFSGTYSGFSGFSGAEGFSGFVVSVAKFDSVAKSSSTYRTSLTISDDPHLFLTLRANSTYYINASLSFINSPSGGGLKMQYNFTGTTVSLFMPTTNTTSSSGNDSDTQTALLTPILFTLTPNEVNVVNTHGIIETGASPGVFSLQWAPQNANGCTLQANSFLDIRLDNMAASGFSGTSGISGFSGYSGKSGYSGASGFSGTSGALGSIGPQGLSGTSGTSGFSGTWSGASGFSGSSGASGFSGNGSSLDQAYDHGGPGNGREINVDAGPISFSAALASTDVLDLRGKVKFLEDNTSDIGNDGANRPKDVFVGNSVKVGNSITVKSDRIKMGIGVAGVPGTPSEGDLSYDNLAKGLRLQTDSESLVIARSEQYLNGWVTYSTPTIELGSIPANSVTTGIIVSVTQGFSSFQHITIDGFSGFSGFSGLVVGNSLNPEAYGQRKNVEDTGPKSVILGDEFGFVTSETPVFATYSGFSGFSALTGKANVTLAYIRSTPEP
jgi:hypothetical protein